jgi:uncharacterized protein with GYD domain
MGLFDLIKKKVSEINKMRELKALEDNFKELILMKMTDDQIKEIILSESRKELEELKEQLEDFSEKSKKKIIRNLAKILDLKTVFSYAEKFDIDFKDIKRGFEERKKQIFLELARIKGVVPTEKVERKEEFEIEIESKPIRSVKRTPLDDVLDLIEQRFEPEPIRNEEDLEKQLAIFLKAHGIKFKRQFCLDGRYFVDIVLEGGYGLELKIIDTSRKIYELVGQIKIYQRRLNDCGALIVIPEDKNEETIMDYLNLLDDEGIKYRAIYCKVLK